ncbi:hypothetical protein NE237_019661 [Protea cynaroides]|uniref:Uncharacterized protein n=1 Tax=Protea cynaroides TaxID=273540 RepID=A0A9Q0H4J0_9MAGN|nr:hypothetical protein NE237_019661 [Protea cynaroides]
MCSGRGRAGSFSNSISTNQSRGRSRGGNSSSRALRVPPISSVITLPKRIPSRTVSKRMHWMDARALRRKDSFIGERPWGDTVCDPWISDRETGGKHTQVIRGGSFPGPDGAWGLPSTLSRLAPFPLVPPVPLPNQDLRSNSESFIYLFSSGFLRLGVPTKQATELKKGLKRRLKVPCSDLASKAALSLTVVTKDGIFESRKLDAPPIRPAHSGERGSSQKGPLHQGRSREGRWTEVDK